MPKISAATAASRRSHILDAARHCFAEHGIHVSVDQICAKAGVSKGAFYVYFSSKDAAIEAIVEDHARVISTLAKLDSVEGVIEKLAAMTTRRSVASCRVELETLIYAQRLPSLHAALQRNMEGLREAMEASIRGFSRPAAVEARMPPDLAAEILTVFSLGLLASVALSTERESHSGEAALNALVRALLTEGPARRPRRAPARRSKRS